MVYCFDFDGTLCNTDGNNYSDSTPKKERIELNAMDLRLLKERTGKLPL